ncbi:lytic transglycosylase domain-containing protein [Paraburkholderia sp. PREW-6R]|uniref:lytic transglycosylase domain-containing protein n=1 Tax=Paraburkholderia sp. PREW-6R TaxID=3141544 RepID=UPI0031F5615E
MARLHHASGVVMIVGGMGGGELGAVAPSMRSTAAYARAHTRSVMVTTATPATASPAAEPSASVASRVMAFAPLIEKAARATQLDAALLMAVIDVESGGNPQAVSPKGASGLMQLMPATGMRHGAFDLFDPQQNIGAGARYLQALLQQFGDLALALAAYNAGEGAVQKSNGQIPPYAETLSYVPKVIARYGWYRDAMLGTTSAFIQEVRTVGAIRPMHRSADARVLSGGDGEGD